MNYSTRHTRFTTTDGWKLAGLLFEPTTASLIGQDGSIGNLNRVAIFLHGNGNASVFESVEKTHAYADALAKEGIAFFTFNNRGAGMIRKLKRETPDGEEEKRGGTAYELIEDCVADIDGALSFLKQEGYTTFYLIGESTGANKIVVYEHLKPQNDIDKSVLVCGGDDTGIYYDMLGVDRFHELLKRAEQAIAEGEGDVLVPSEELNGGLMSWQSLHDTIDPDGLYNIFPYNDAMNGLHLSRKPLFLEFSAIRKPLLAIYGEKDEFCYGRIPEVVALLRKNTSSTDFSSLIIPGADHGFTGKLAELSQAVAGWLAS